MGTSFLVLILLPFYFQKSHQSQTETSSLYVSTFVDGTFVTLDAMVADTLVDCIAACRTLATCSVVEFKHISKSCHSLKRDELGLVDTGGVQVYVDIKYPSKLV